ncbi:MAG: hypothetical protein K2L22_00060 [Muribaculaceae bacterium]|nr:hypothetical protein [Muribaculaceae bacterium]
MDTGGKSERILWTVLANLARLGLMAVFVTGGFVVTVMGLSAGDSNKNVLYALIYNLIIDCSFLLLIWEWTPKKQRWIWFFSYLIAVVLMFFYY